MGWSPGALTRAPGRRGFFALISAETSTLLRASDDVAITRQIVSTPTHRFFVSSTFTSPTAAVFWLTNSTPTDVVQSVAERNLFCARSATALVGGWLAVVSHRASSCFDVNRSGMEEVLSLMKNSVSPVCAVGRFVMAADAHQWVTSPATEEWLQILVESVAADASHPPPPVLASAGLRPVASVGQAVRDCTVSVATVRRAREAAASGRRLYIIPAAAPAVCVTGRAGARLGDVRLGTPGKGLAQADGGQCRTPEAGTTRSPFAVWSALSAASSVADVDEPST